MKKLKLFLIVFFSIISFSLVAQDQTNEKISELNDKINGLQERVATNESDLSKLNKIKVSGYIQAQYQNFENPTLLSTSQNYFSVRRARVKFTYEATDGVKFVLQPDFAPVHSQLKMLMLLLTTTGQKHLAYGQVNLIDLTMKLNIHQRLKP